MKIYKQKLDIIQEQVIELKAYQTEKNVKITRLSVQNNFPCIWFMTDKDVPVLVKISCFMTGEDIPETINGDEYIGSVVIESGIVIHVFMKIL